MSDVSGIPYMGPMGQGNFFAPQFSNNPQMSAGQIQSAYMPEFYNNQNVVNNLYGGGANAGFGQLTNYYSALGANQLSGIGSLNPYGVFGEGGGGGGGISYQGGDVGASGATINNDAWRTSSQGPDFMGGGGLFSGSLSNFPQQQSYGGPSIDWSGVGRAAASLGSSGGDPFSGMSMPGGLNSPMTMPQQQPLDYSSLFGRGVGGGGGTDPYPGMAMPGGLNAPMIMPQQPAATDPYPGMAMPGGLSSPMTAQPPAYDYGSLFGQGAGGTGAKPSSVFDTGAAPVIGTQDTGPYGGGAGIGGLDTGRAIGTPYTQAAEPQRGMLGPPVTEAYNPYFNVTGGEGAGPRMDAGTSGAPAPGGGLTAADLSEQARAKLAELMAKPKEPSPAEVFAGDKPVPTEGQPAPTETAAVPTDPYAALPGEAGRGGMVGRPAATSPATDIYPGEDAPRPSASIPTQLQNRDLARGVNPRLVAAVEGGSQFLPPGYSVKIVSGVRESTPGHPQAYHRTIGDTGQAMDVQITGPDGDILHKGNDYTGMYTQLARGVKTWAAQNDPGALRQMGYGGAFETSKGSGNPDLMHFDWGGSRGSLRPEAQWANLKPLAEAEKNAMPAYIPMLGENQVPLDRPVPLGPGYSASVPPLTDRALPTVPSYEASGMSASEAPRAAPLLPAQGPVTQAYPGADAPRPPADVPDPRVSGAGFNALDAAAPPSGVEKAQSFLNRPLESILRQYSPENLSAAGFVLDLKQPMREALKGPFGGQILSGLQPKLGDVGLTRADFAKAVADPRARFGGEFGGMAGELPSAGSFTPFEGFRQSADFENRSNEQLGRDQLAELQARAIGYEPGPEAASTPLSSALGLGDLPVPQAGQAAGLAQPPGAGGDVWSGVPQPAAGDGRDQLAQLQTQPAPKSMTFSGFSPSPEPRKGGVGPEMEPPTPEFMRTIAEAESSSNPNKQDKGSQYSGLFQLNKSEFTKYGGTGSIYDADQNALAAMGKMTKEGQQAQDILGRALSPVEQYMVHQQGLAGTISHLQNPDQPAWQSFQQASKWSDERAKTAIWGNLSSNQKAQFGNDVNNITSRDFINLWANKYLEKQVESGQPMTFPGGFSAGP